MSTLVISTKRNTVLCAVFCFIFHAGIPARAQHFSLRNNLVYDAALTPNLGFDVQVAPRWSLGANVGFRPWPTDDNVEKKWRHLLIAPELRRWNMDQQRLRLAKDDSLYRSRTGYWGLNLIYSHYNVGGVTFPFGLYKTVRDHRMQGDLAAVGIFYGYTWRLSRWLRLETEAGLGAGYAWAKKYDCPYCGTDYGRDDKPFLIPKVAVNLVLDVQKPRQQVYVPQIVSRPPMTYPTDKTPSTTRFSLVSYAASGDTNVAVINKANELLSTDCGECHARALSMLLTVANDARSWNALGVALFLNGRREEAIGYLRRAADNGNEEARKNLLQIEN